MHIRGLIPRNFAEFAEFAETVPIGKPLTVHADLYGYLVSTKQYKTHINDVVSVDKVTIFFKYLNHLCE